MNFLEPTPMIGVSKHEAFYEAYEKIMDGLGLGKYTFVDAINMIHDMMAEEIPDGNCAESKRQRDLRKVRQAEREPQGKESQAEQGEVK